MDKRLELLNYLASQPGPIPNRQLQTVLGVSRRTVINYVNELNSLENNVILSSNQGYRCADSQALLRLRQNLGQTLQFDTFEKRRDFLFEEILLRSTHPDLDELALEMCISPATLNNELGRLRAELKEHGLYLKTKNNRLFIIGDDRDKRKFTMGLLGQELNHSHFNLETMQKFFQHANIAQIEEIVTETLRKNAYFLDDFSSLNYVLHLAICIETAITQKETPEKDAGLPHSYPFTHHVFSIVEELYEKLKEIYHIDFSFEQVLDASALMATRIVSVNLSSLQFDQLGDVIPEPVRELLFKITTSVHDIYGIDLRTDNFMVRFAFHLKNLLERAANSILIPENNFITIKNDFPFLYVIAEYISSVINRQCHVELPENEISYIALHLGVLMEENNTISSKINCTLVLYDYYNMGVSIFEHIKQLSAPVNLTGIVTSYDQIPDPDSVDLIITTLPELPPFDIPSVRIHLIPTRQDYDAIISQATQLAANIEKRTLSRKINYLFKKELFFPDTDFATSEEAIKFLCGQMEAHGYVDAQFESEILYHEEIAPSSYRNVALPHPLTTDENHTCISSIAVAINRHPVPWAENQVDFIFLMSLRGEDRPLFKDLFSLISNFLQTDENCRILKACNSQETFVQLLTTM